MDGPKSWSSQFGKQKIFSPYKVWNTSWLITGFVRWLVGWLVGGLVDGALIGRSVGLRLPGVWAVGQSTG